MTKIGFWKVRTCPRHPRWKLCPWVVQSNPNLTSLYFNFSQLRKDRTAWRSLLLHHKILHLQTATTCLNHTWFRRESKQAAWLDIMEQRGRDCPATCPEDASGTEELVIGVGPGLVLAWTLCFIMSTSCCRRDKPVRHQEHINSCTALKSHITSHMDIMILTFRNSSSTRQSENMHTDWRSETEIISSNCVILIM